MPPAPEPNPPSVGDSATVGPPVSVGDAATVTGDIVPRTTAAPPAAPPGYAIERELGRGGMGVVYLATQTGLNRPAALKMLLGGGDARSVIRFLAESEAVAAVRHPHVVEVYQFGEHDGNPFLALEYCPGGSLDARLAAGPLDPRAAAVLMAKVAAGVGAAHAAGIVHRDVKPHNVLLTATGEPKVTDFGLAKRGDAGDLTKTNAVMGTPAYMPPEQARGDTKFVSPGADVWALGVVLYECLTGRRPFDGADTWAILAAVQRGDFPAPRTANRRVPRDLELVCLKCMSREPADRYPTAVELAADLDNWLAGRPITARPIGRARAFAKWVRRNKVVAAALAVAGLAMAGGTAVSVWQAVRADGEADAAKQSAERADDEAAAAKEATRRAEAQLDRAEGLVYANNIEAAQRHWDEGRTAVAFDKLDAGRPDYRGWEHDLVYSEFASRGPSVSTGSGLILALFPLSFSPDGERVARGSGAGRVRVWPAADERASVVLADTQGVATALGFSPDGRRLAVGMVEGLVRVWDVDGRNKLWVGTGHTGNVSAACFSPDGTRLATGSSDGVRVWDATDGRPLAEFVSVPGRVLGLGFSPDGRRLAIGSDGDAAVRVWHPATGEPTVELKGHSEPVERVGFSPDGTRLASGSRDRTVRMWDTATWQPAATPIKHRTRVTAVRFSPDGRRGASGSADGALRVWEVTSGQVETEFRHAGQVDDVCFGPDGGRLLSVAANASVRVWDVRTAAAVSPLVEKSLGDSRWRVSPDGTRVAAWGRRDGIRVWDAVRGRLLGDLTGHLDATQSVGWSPNSDRLVVASKNGTVRVWDTATLRPSQTLQEGANRVEAAGPFTSVAGLCFSPDGTRIAGGQLAGGREGLTLRVRIWEAATGRPVSEFTLPPRSVWDSHDGRVIPEKELPRDAAEYAGTGRFTPIVSTLVWATCFSPDARWLACSIGATTQLWDTRSGRLAALLSGHVDVVTGVGFNADGTRLATASADSTVRLWDVAGRPIAVLTGHTGHVISVRFSPDGHRVVSGSSDGTVRVWDAATGRATLELKVGTPVSEVAFAADGRRLMCVGEDGTTRVWEARLGYPQVVLSGPLYSLRRVAFSPDGVWIYAEDGLLNKHAWEVRTGRPAPPGHSTPDFPRPKTRDVQQRAILVQPSSVATPTTQQATPDAPTDGVRSPDGKLIAQIAGATVILRDEAKYAAVLADERRRSAAAVAPDPDWHRRQAADAETDRHWFAAAFHLRRLAALAPGDADIRRRLAAAEAKLAAREPAPPPRPGR